MLTEMKFTKLKPFGVHFAKVLEYGNWQSQSLYFCQRQSIIRQLKTAKAT